MVSSMGTRWVNICQWVSVRVLAAEALLDVAEAYFDRQPAGVAFGDLNAGRGSVRVFRFTAGRVRTGRRRGAFAR